MLSEATKNQIQTLRLFNQKVERLERSGLATRFSESEPNVVASFDSLEVDIGENGVFSFEGVVRSSLEDFDQDEIDAFVLTYRMFTQNNDRLSIHSLAQIYSSGLIPAEGQDCFEQARLKMNERLDSPATISFEDGEISIRQVMGIVIYGGLAHSKIKEEAIFSSWVNSGISGFIWAEFVSGLRFVLSYLKYFRELNMVSIAHIERLPN